MKYFLGLFLTGLVLLSAPVFAKVAMVAPPVSDLYAYETSEGLKVGAIFGTLHTQSPLVSVTSPVCDHAEIHEMSEENGIMKMREVKEVRPQGEDGILTLSPMGYHVMLMELKSSLKAGDSFDATFMFADGTSHTHKVRILTRSQTTEMDSTQ